MRGTRQDGQPLTSLAPASKQLGAFTRAQVCRMLGITERQLASWERQGWIQPRSVMGKAADGGARAADGSVVSHDSAEPAQYGFSEIAMLRTLLRLRQNGVSSRRLRSVHAALLSRLGGASQGAADWSRLQMRKEGARISVFFQGTRMEPLSGQLLFEYSPTPADKKLKPITAKARSAQISDALVKAERFFQAGLRYEERPGTISRAIRAYQKAIELNPRATGAYINLGTIYYNQGRLSEAEKCYRAALNNSPDYALVHFNLANLFDELGNWKQACQHYEEAIRLDPRYPDPRYNLALVYEKLGKHGKALEQWRGYLKLDSQSPWASHARKRVAQAPLRVLPWRHAAEPAERTTPGQSGKTSGKSGGHPPSAQS